MSDVDEIERSRLNKAYLVQMLDQFTILEKVRLSIYDSLITYLLSSDDSDSITESWATYQKEIDALAELIVSAGSTDKLADELIDRMKKLDAGEYVRVPLNKSGFLVLNLRIEPGGSVVGFIAYHKDKDSKADGLGAYSFFDAILETNHLYDWEVDHWML